MKTTSPGQNDVPPKEVTEQSARISTFVSLVLVEQISSYLGAHANFMTGTGEHSGRQSPQFALLSALGACVQCCTTGEDILDQDGLNRAVDNIRDAARSCLELVKCEAAKIVAPLLADMLDELDFEGRLTLEEAMSGFPASGGRFPAWKVLTRRRLQARGLPPCS